MSVFCSESSSESSVFWIKIFLLWFEAASSSIKILFLVLTNFTIEVKFLFKWTLVILWANVFAMCESKFPFSGKLLFPWVGATFPLSQNYFLLEFEASFSLSESHFIFTKMKFSFKGMLLFPWKEVFSLWVEGTFFLVQTSFFWSGSYLYFKGEATSHWVESTFL